MRLANWSLSTYRLPYRRAVAWSDVREEAATFVLLWLVDEDGRAGVAEITVKPTWSGTTPRTVAAAFEELLLPLLSSADLADVAGVRARLDTIPDHAAAKALVDNAVWDLHAAARGEPLWMQWNGRERVDVSWAVTRQRPAAMIDEAIDKVSKHGFRTLKIKGGQGLDADLAAVRGIRDALGPGVRLYVDANGAYARDAAADYVAAMADAGADLVEDPAPLVPDAGFRVLQDAVRVPVLVDFDCRSPRDAHLFIEAGARALSLKPGRVGLSDARAMRAMASAAGVECVVGLFGESALGTAAALQLAATLPEGGLPAEVTWFLEMERQIVRESLPVNDGAIALPRAPSLSSLVDVEALERLAGCDIASIAKGHR